MSVLKLLLFQAAGAYAGPWARHIGSVFYHNYIRRGRGTSGDPFTLFMHNSAAVVGGVVIASVLHEKMSNVKDAKICSNGLKEK
jgi:hypothetical protein